jgi:type I restriction enzyme S subunit
MHPKEDAAKEFVYLALTRPDIIDHFAHLADGGAYPAIRPDVVADLEHPLPAFEIVEAFSKITSPLLKLMGRNMDEANSLAVARDFLLPMLLTGELRYRQ